MSKRFVIVLISVLLASGAGPLATPASAADRHDCGAKSIRA